MGASLVIHVGTAFSPTWKSTFLWLMVFGLCLSVRGQDQGVKPATAMNGAEQRMLSSMMERFQPLPSVARLWQGAFESAAMESLALKARVDSLERSDMNEGEVLIQVGALRQQLRVIKSDRNAFVAGFLSGPDKLALDSLLSPSKPSIQHFGFHDRLECLVCKSPDGLSLPPGVPRPTLKQ